MNESPLDFSRWMRTRFPELNEKLDENPTTALLGVLCDEVLQLFPHSIEEIEKTSSDSQKIREMFTYISMIHTALYHHKQSFFLLGEALPANFDTVYERIEDSLMYFAMQLGVEHRFLASFYLLYNPELEGKSAQFRPGKGEAAFAGANKTGMILFRTAALALLDAAKFLTGERTDTESVANLLRTASEAFNRIIELNRDLAQHLDRKEFELLTKYFSTVSVRGRELRGVNAGDQPWSYIIDLLLGVDLKQAFETAFGRVYPVSITTSAQVVAHEFQAQNYLRANYLLPEDYARLEETIELMNAGSATLHARIEDRFMAQEQETLIALLEGTVRKYVMTSNTHYGLAKKYVPVDKETGEQIGSSGTNIEKFLKRGLIDERMRILQDIEREHSNVVVGGVLPIVTSK
jgi:hypothetical protein